MHLLFTGAETLKLTDFLITLIAALLTVIATTLVASAKTVKDFVKNNSTEHTEIKMSIKGVADEVKAIKQYEISKLDTKITDHEKRIRNIENERKGA